MYEYRVDKDRLSFPNKMTKKHDNSRAYKDLDILASRGPNL